jgi:hypothetical protein
VKASNLTMCKDYKEKQNGFMLKITLMLVYDNLDAVPAM